MNQTHNPDLKSWVESANTVDTDFPIQNLPLGVFTTRDEPPHIGVAIGDRILDLHACARGGLLDRIPVESMTACTESTLNALMSLGPSHWSALRRRVSELLQSDSTRRMDTERCIVSRSEVQMQLPADIGDYTDFYASVYHATNVGGMFRPDNPLLPNYKYVPIGYHGRASSIIVSGSAFHRPVGQTKADDAKEPSVGPSRLLDFELEVGFFVGPANALGERVAIDKAGDYIFGLCLLNDWSARDIQKWEYQPLGPFLAKNFATTISPWIVTMEALEPFRVPAFIRPPGDPQPLAYLDSSEDQTRGGIGVTLEVHLLTERMRKEGQAPFKLSRGNFKEMYWTVAQMLAHHTSNGCNLRPGDLMGSGTVSGPTKDSHGCLLELTRGGREPIQLPNGETRKFLQDGDEVIIKGYCERAGYARIGFGECRGIVLPAR
jgi:fumarylacetoacetase